MPRDVLDSMQRGDGILTNSATGGNTRDYLRRLPPEYYRGQVCVRWSMTIDERKTGWLIPILYYKFREILTHAALRYGLCCPLYCCMPDHLHLLWIGILDSCDQRKAARFFRRQLNIPLAKLGVQLQKQPYDHVLREEEIGGTLMGGTLTSSATENRGGLAAVAEYIARNPERAGLVPVDGFRGYPYTGCLVPGYPDLSPWQENYWTLFWKLYSRLRTHGLSADSDD